MFSPTDLLASAFASCVLTIMGKMAARTGDDLTGTSVEIDKVMAESPRRVGEFILNITFPAHFTKEMKQSSAACYAGAVNACPVHQTLRADVKTTVHIH